MKQETDDAVEMMERIEIMVAIMNEIALLKKNEQKVYVPQEGPEL